MLFDDFKNGLGIIFHPDREANINLGLKEVFVTYYKFSMVPIILTVVAALIISISLPEIFATVPSSQLIGGSEALTAFSTITANSLIIILLLIPVVLLVIAGMLHAIGKLLRMLEGSFARTFTAVVYAEFASLLFWFVNLFGAFGNTFGAFGGIVYLIALIYGVYVLVVGLSKQHKTSTTNAFVVGLIVFVLLAVVGFAFVSSYATALQSSGALSGG